MLILSRRAAECIYLGDDIVLTIVAVGNDKVRIGVKAPVGIRILRNELGETQFDEHETILTFPADLGDSSQDFEVPKPSIDTSVTDLKGFMAQRRRAA